MKTVRDDRGNHYLLLKESDEASLVRDPHTGNECYVGNDRLEPVEGVSTMETMARRLSKQIRSLVACVHDDDTLGLVMYLAERGPVSATTLIESTTRCESDLNGQLSTLRAAGIVEATTVGSEPGYRLTDAGATGVEALVEATKSMEASSTGGESTGAESGQSTEPARR